MRRFLVGAVIAAGILASAGTSAHAAAPTFECKVGGSGTYELFGAPTLPGQVLLSNEAGAKIGVSAWLAHPMESGVLNFSGGSPVLDFPSTKAEISGAISTANLMLLPVAGSVTVTLTCNPGAEGSQPSAASGSNMVRGAAKEHFADIARRLSQEMHGGSWDTESARHDTFLGVLREFAVDFMGRDPALVDAILASAQGEQYRTFLGIAATEVEEIEGRTDLTDLEKAQRFSNSLTMVNATERQFLRENPSFASRSPTVANSYAEFPTINSSAVKAINRAAGASDVVQGSFNLLGYGPTGGFSSSVTLARGQNWLLEASAFGAISQTDASAGGTVSISGRGTINLVGALAPRLVAGLSLGLGATSENGSIGDNAHHYAVGALVSYSATPDLTVTGNLDYELTSHNYSSGSATGNRFSHLYSAGVGLQGNAEFAAFKLTPSFGVELSQEHAAAVTLSDGTTLAGFDRTTGKATVGAVVSQDYPWEEQGRSLVFTPSLGADASLSHSQGTTTAGGPSSQTQLGLGLTAGMALAFEDGLGLSLSTRISRSGETTGGSVTGKISASF